MISRRTLLSSLIGAAALKKVAWAAGSNAGRLSIYAAVGPELVQYDANTDEAALVRRASVSVSSNVQYAWPHKSGRFLYVSFSNRISPSLVAGGTKGGSGGSLGDSHQLAVFRIDSVTGVLTPHGKPIELPSRPIHVTTDIPSDYVLVAFSKPSAIRVYRVNSDATLGQEVKQTAAIDPGIYGHQVRVTPNNKVAILVTRGNDAAEGKPEDPGALKVFNFKDGQLTNEVSIAPHNGIGFGPRHLDFHPTKPWMYVSLERSLDEKKLYVYRMDGDSVNPSELFRKNTLSDPEHIRSPQSVATVHVHPNGRFVYTVNRADATTEFEGKRVFAGGENNIAVHVIDQKTGEPTLIQNADSHGISPRTFDIDPTGKMLVAAHMEPILVKEGASVRTVPASLVTFRILGDGKLEFVRKYDVEVGPGMFLFWMGMVNR